MVKALSIVALPLALVVFGCASTQPYTQKRDAAEEFALGEGAGVSSDEAPYLERLRLDPGDFDAYYNLGVYYEAQGQVDRAEGAYKKTLLLEPRHVAASVNLAGLYRQRGEDRKAIVTLSDLFDTGMDDPRARTDLAILYRLTGDFDRSLYESGEVLKRFGMVYGAMLNAGMVYLDLGKVEMALTLFLQLKQDYPEDSRVRFSIGKAYQALGNPFAAEQEYVQAISLDTNAYEAHNNIGVLRLLKQDYAGATTAFIRATEANVNFATGYLNLGIAQRNLEKFDEAEKAYRRALKIRPNSKDAAYNLALLYDDYWNRPDNAINDWRNYLKNFDRDLSDEEKERVRERLTALNERREKLRATKATQPEATQPVATPSEQSLGPADEVPPAVPAEPIPPAPTPEPASSTPAAPDFSAIVGQYNEARAAAGLAPVEPTKLIETLAQKAAELEADKGGSVTFEVRLDEAGKPKLVPLVRK